MDAAIEFLTDAGHITDDQRQEFILLSDVLGASMQTITVNNQAASAMRPRPPCSARSSPEHAPEIELGGDIAGAASGTPCWVEGTVTDAEGRPVPRRAHRGLGGGRRRLLRRAVRRRPGGRRGRTCTPTRRAGTRFWALTPTPYPIPDDGPVGVMLRAVGRSPVRASHLHFMVTAPGYRTPRHAHLRRGRRPARARRQRVRCQGLADQEFAHQPGGTPTPDGRDLGGRDWTRTRFDIVLAPEG